MASRRKMVQFVAIWLVGAVASLTQASLVTINFAGYVNGGEAPVVPLNTTVTGHWTYDDTLTGSFGTGWDLLSGARFGPMEASMQFGDVQASTLSSTNAVLHLGFVTWGGGVGAPTYSVHADPYVQPDGTVTGTGAFAGANSFSITLIGPAMSTDTWWFDDPPTIPDPAGLSIQFPSGIAAVGYPYDPPNPYMPFAFAVADTQIVLTSLSLDQQQPPLPQVPAPGVALLATLGAALATAVRRRRML